MNYDEFAQMNIEDFPTIHMIDGLIDEALKDDTVAPNGLSVSSLDGSSVGLSGCSLAVVSLVANTLSLLLSFLGISVEIAAVEGEVIALLASDGKFLPSVVEAVSGFRNANGWDRPFSKSPDFSITPVCCCVLSKKQCLISLGGKRLKL